MAVAIVTDSAAAIPLEVARDHDVAIVPMHLMLRGADVREGDRTLAEVLAADDVTTSGPTPGEFETAIGDHLGSDGTLVLTIASTMSSTYEAAVLAARTLERPEVRVVDTKTAAGAEALVVLAAARAAQRGASLDEVESVARSVLDRVRLVATVPSLDRLVQSGRVPAIAGWAGRHLGINPLFEFVGGDVRRMRPALGPEAAHDRMAALCRRSYTEGSQLHVAALHALAAEDAQRLLARVTRELEPAEAFVGEFGAVMVAHTGPGLVGLAWWWEGPVSASR